MRRASGGRSPRRAFYNGDVLTARTIAWLVAIVIGVIVWIYLMRT
jgi:hypothetical protein